MSLRDTLDNIPSSPVPSNEQEAITETLLILQGLGWDPLTEVKQEYAVGGRDGGKVDIALVRPPSRVVAFIEAKAPREDLERHIKQVVQYAFHEGVDVCVLTNGLQWWLYLPMMRVPFEERRFALLHIREDPLEQLQEDLESFVSRENLLSGKARHLAEQRRLERAVREVWHKIRTGPDDALVDMVRQRVHEQVNLRPDRQQVAEVLRRREVVKPEIPPPPEPEPPDAPNVPDPTARPVGVHIWGRYHPVRNWIDVLCRVTESLYERHGSHFDKVLVDSIQRGNDRVSRNPSDFARPREVGSTGLYIYRGDLTKEKVRQRSRLFLERLGHAPTDLEIVFSAPSGPASTPPAQTNVEPPVTEALPDHQSTQDSRPTGILLWDERHEVKYWRDVLLAVASALYNRYGTDFDRVLEERGRKHPWASRLPEDIPRARAEVGSSGIYLDTHFSAADMRKRARALLELFDHNPAELEYLYE